MKLSVNKMSVISVTKKMNMLFFSINFVNFILISVTIKDVSVVFDSKLYFREHAD